ncbi:hypothetical protein ACLOJK_039016 [Asimina triloba]
MDQHRNDTRRFLLKPISPSIFFKHIYRRFVASGEAWIGRSRPPSPLPPPTMKPTIAKPPSAARRLLPTSQRLHTCCLARAAATTKSTATTTHAASLACHRLARPLPAACHSARRQCRHGRVSPTVKPSDDQHPRIEDSYSAPLATVLERRLQIDAVSENEKHPKIRIRSS